jgi:hypothetical protein
MVGAGGRFPKSQKRIAYLDAPPDSKPCHYVGEMTSFELGLPTGGRDLLMLSLIIFYNAQTEEKPRFCQPVLWLWWA